MKLLVCLVLMLFITSNPISAQWSERDKLNRSIVYIECEDHSEHLIVEKDDGTHTHRARRVHKGTGVIISDGGRILTASHLVPGAEEEYENTVCRGIRGTGARQPTRYLVIEDKLGKYDAITLQFVREPFETFEPIPFLDLKDLDETVDIYARGFPQDRFATGAIDARKGNVFSFAPDSRGIVGVSTDFAQGMSGGPVLVETDDLVGIIIGVDFDNDSFPIRYGMLAAEKIARLAGMNETGIDGSPTEPTSGTGEVIENVSLQRSLVSLSLNEHLATLDPDSPTFVPFSVIGEDDREVIIDTRNHPFRAVVQLIIETGTSGKARSCTGVVVSEDTILTVAPCLVEDGRFVQNVTAIPGRNVGMAPFGSCVSERVFVAEDYLNGIAESNPQFALYQLAAVRLDCPIGERVGYLGLEATEEIYNNFELLGYPTNIQPVGRQWKSRGKFREELQAGILLHDADTGPGSEGSPIISDDGQTVVAIHIGSGTAIRLTSSRIRQIKDWISTDRPTLKPNSIVQIACENGNKTTIGSGFVATESGRVVTAKHILGDDDAKCSARIGQLSPTKYQLKKIARSETLDLALLQLPIEAQFSVVDIGRFRSQTLGENVEVRGFDGQTELPFFAKGYVLSNSRSSTDGILIEARIVPGMEGAPVVSDEGEFLGMVTGAKFTNFGTLAGTTMISAVDVLTELGLE